ncbi:MAG: type IV pilus biogenesis/stability protein PilW [Chromatiales bacterium]|nr:type IV pilus biogenesis/stability protein PilW [Chromatiales bacterium]
MIRNLLGTLISLLFLVSCASGPNEKSVKFNPKAAEANAELGKNYIQLGNYEIALGKLKKALGYNPKSVNANHYIAELYRRLDKSEEADKHYKIAIENSVNDSALFNNYGVYLCGEKRIDEAMVQFNKVLSNPVYRFPEQVYENLGLCMEKNNHTKEAELNLRKALAINPNRSQSLFELSRISLRRGKLFSARAFMNRYNDNSKSSAKSLGLAIEIETKLKDSQAVKSYGEQLLKMFPLSEEAEKYHRLNMR